MTSQIIHFNEGDVRVEKICSKWFAELVDEESPTGYGTTMMEAIYDLNEKLKET